MLNLKKINDSVIFLKNFFLNHSEGLIVMRKEGVMGDQVVLIVKRLDKKLTSVEVSKKWLNIG